MLEGFNILYLVAILVSAVYLVLSLIITRRETRKMLQGTAVESQNGVSVLKPLKGADENLLENLRSFFEQDYPDFEIIFGVKDADDPAVKVVWELQAQYPHVCTKLVIDERQYGLNPKVNNLQNIFYHSEKEFILISDSDTHVQKDYLKKLMPYANDNSVGLVLSALRGVGASNWIAAMENLHINAYITPNVFALPVIFKRYISIGKSMLLSKETLKKLGGFSAFGRYLAEDHQIGQKIKDLKLKIVTAPVYVDAVNNNWTLKKFFNRHTRWAKMRRSLSARDYIAETISNPVALGFVFACIDFGSLGIGLLFILILLKIMNDVYLTRLLKAPLKWHYYAFSPLKDLIIGLLWYVPFLNRKINWRGNILKIGKNTILYKPGRFYDTNDTAKLFN